MRLPRLDHITHIADQLNTLAAIVKTRSRASLTDANRILETITKRFFNALFGWDLVNLNTHQANYPAADLGDRQRRIAIQVTNEDSSDKIKRTATKAIKHKLGTDFKRLIVFFLLPRKPGLPKNFTQPIGGPSIETWDIADLLKQLQDLKHLKALTRAAKVLDEEMGKVSAPVADSKFDISRIVKYAPADLIGREEESKLLNDAWAKVRKRAKKHPYILTFVALGGEGKTALVAKWTADLAFQDWPGCYAAFAWSFYSQGTRKQMAASSDLFLKEALTFFGDDADKRFAASNAGAFEKGQRLASVVGQRRSVLILDGLEPLQYAPTSTPFPPGQLKDQGVAKLLKDLATNNQGLCVVTTRYSLPDLSAFAGKTVREEKLTRLSRKHGVDLLRKLGVHGSERRNIPLKDGDSDGEKVNEFEKLVEDVKGHALTLTLIGGFLKRAFHGDIRQRDRVKFEKADAQMDGGHAFRTMAAYEQWLLRDGGDEGRREVAVLRLMGLFDRPADAACLAALRNEPISGITEPLDGLADDDWEFCLSGLETAKLLTVNRCASGALVSLDAHPLLREYFARKVRTQHPEALRAAHQRLYEHLCKTTTDRKLNPTLQDLQPLYQAVAHGCQAGSYQDAADRVYTARILRGNTECYSEKVLGAMGANLATLASFFVHPWDLPVNGLRVSTRIWVISEVGRFLRCFGRLVEAYAPTSLAVELTTQALRDEKNPERFNFWNMNGGKQASNLSELDLALGDVPAAIRAGERSVKFAEASSSVFHQILFWCTLADALHEAGRSSDAERCFCNALARQQAFQPDFPFLYSMAGFRFCEFELGKAERIAWRVWLGSADQMAKSKRANPGYMRRGDELSEFRNACESVKQHAFRNLALPRMERIPLECGLANLTLGRAHYFLALLSREMTNRLPAFALDASLKHLETSVTSLRQAGYKDYEPRGLLSRAWLNVVKGRSDLARVDLDEAWEIAELGPMKLHITDIHLHRARLFFREKKYPKEWISPQDDLAAAEKLINACGYHRRDEELADAKRAILGT